MNKKYLNIFLLFTLLSACSQTNVLEPGESEEEVRSEEQEEVACLEEKAGEILWTYEMGAGTSGSPAIDGNSLYLATFHDTTFHSIDTESGQANWVRDLKVVGAESSATIGLDGTVYFNTLLTESSSGEIRNLTSETIDGFKVTQLRGTVALDPEDGSLVWVYSRNNGADGSPSLSADGELIYSSDVYNLKMLAQDPNVKLSTPYTYAIDAETGELLWKSANNGWAFSSAAVSPVTNQIYVGVEDYLDDQVKSVGQWGYEGELKALDAKTGELLWQHDGDGEFDRGPAIFYENGEERIVAGNQVGDILVFDQEGKVLAERDFAAFGFGTMVVGDYIYVAFGKPLPSGSMENTNTLFALDKKTLETVWTYPFDNAELTPAIGQEALYGVDRNGIFFALDPKIGEELWTLDLKDPIFYGYIVIDEAGAAYTVAFDGTLYKIQTESCGGYAEDAAWPSYRGASLKATGQPKE